MKKPLIGITMGDPSGIGPEILLKCLSSKEIYEKCVPVVIGDASVLREQAQFIDAVPAVVAIEHFDQIDRERSEIQVLDNARVNHEPFRIGISGKENGEAAYQFLIQAIDLCVAGKIKAVVTAPLSKSSLHAAGRKFNGHTEILAWRTKTDNYRMVMAAQQLKVILTTIHLSLREACDKITKEAVYETIRLGWEHLKQWGISSPKIAVCGLNPHAGEEGLFGSEEAKYIQPAIAKAVSNGIQAEGPLPADTAFYWAYKGRYDLVVAQYHDQGLIPIKLIAFDTAVNVTVGLPIIRTSVDHGTAFDIAGKGIADASSLRSAIEYALKLI